ncbi:hypothetical protein [Hoeflea sp.]|uniref:hypothetical protein n=1 Tax=Hoeflea sp. TaxID=1940281 RepID=UPI0037494293
MLTLLTYLAVLVAAAGVIALLAAWLMQLADLTRRIVFLLAFSGILVFWHNGIRNAGENQLPGTALQHVSITPDASNFIIGANILAQNQSLPGSASDPHIGFIRDISGGWQLSNISETRRLSLTYRLAAPTNGSGSPQPDRSGILDKVRSVIGLVQGTDRKSGSRSETVSFNADRFLLASGDQIVGQGALANRFEMKIEHAEIQGQGDAKIHKLLFELDGERYEFEKKNSGSLTLTSDNWLAECPTSWSNAAKDWLRGWSGSGEVTLAYIGGNIEPCRRDDRIYLARVGMQFSGLNINFVPGLGFAVIGSGRDALQVRRNGTIIPLSTLEHPFDFSTGGKTYKLDSFIAGYTRYEIARNPETDPAAEFHIVPVSNAHRIVSADHICQDKNLTTTRRFIGRKKCRNVEGAAVEWAASKTGAPKNDPKLPHDKIMQQAPNVLLGAFLSVIIGLCVVLMFTQGFSAFGPANLVRMLVFALGFGIVLASAWLYLDKIVENTELTPRPPYLAVLAWGLAGVAVLFARGSKMADSVLFLIWTLIVAFGHIAMVSLSLAMEETRFLRFADDTSLAVGISAGTLLCISQFPPASIRAFLQFFSKQTRIEMLFWKVVPKISGGGLPWFAQGLLALLIFSLSAAWILLGSETGIAGIIQPSEVIKTLFAISLGVLLILVFDKHSRGRKSRRFSQSMVNGQISAPMMLTGFLLGLAIGSAIWIATGAFLLSVFSGLLLIACIWSLKDPFWRGFGLILLVVGFMLAAPASRSDMSPILIIGFTTILTFAISSLMHLIAAWNNRVVGNDDELWHIGTIPMRPRIRQNGMLSGSMWLQKTWSRLRPYLTMPYPVLIVLPAILVFTALNWSQHQLRNGEEAKGAMINHLGSFGGILDVPIKRAISWIEFNATPPAVGAIVPVEFADTALQVDQSRKSISASACNIVEKQVSSVEPRSGSSWVENLTSRLVNMAEHSKHIIDTGVDRASRSMLGAQCSPNSDNRSSVEIAQRIFAIQSDFVGTWLIAYFGRDGALVLAMLQSSLIAGMLLASFLILRWQPGMSEERPAANMSAFAVVSFAIMIALQWIISWANAFGTVPVMGQPATFLSHGRSHFIFFGMPALVFTISALRMRAAFKQSRTFWRIDKAREIPLMPLGFNIWHMMRRFLPTN